MDLKETFLIPNYGLCYYSHYYTFKAWYINIVFCLFLNIYRNTFFRLLHNKLPNLSRTDVFRWICKYLTESKLVSIIKGIKESYVI